MKGRSTAASKLTTIRDRAGASVNDNVLDPYGESRLARKRKKPTLLLPGVHRNQFDHDRGSLAFDDSA
jgi:hypothetical protein